MGRQVRLAIVFVCFLFCPFCWVPPFSSYIISAYVDSASKPPSFRKSLPTPELLFFFSLHDSPTVSNATTRSILDLYHHQVFIMSPTQDVTLMKKEEISSTNVGTILINFGMTKQKHGKLLFF
jgi:hypothetical protein